jgi:hypothetical protein
MINTFERSDIIHIMKMNHFILSDSDTVELSFNDQGIDRKYQVSILLLEDLPQVYNKQNQKVIFNTTLKSVDDL